MDLVAKLPWWAGVLLAVVSFSLLHRATSQQVVFTGQPGQVAGMLTQSVWLAAARVGQFVLPIICLVGAGMSAWRRTARKKLVVNVTQSEAANSLEGMSWREFEMLVGEGFRMQGYSVLETGGDGADGGIDLVLTRPGSNGAEKFLVQCKQWRAFKVGVDVVRELYGVMAARGATGGFVVTSGRFTEEAVKFASGRNVMLVDGPKLQSLLRRAKGAEGERPIRPTGTTSAVPADLADGSSSICPSCAKPMVRRTANRGTNAGREFWGCTGYPNCRATRPIV